MFRFAFLTVLTLPAMAMAEDFQLRAPVTAAEVYPQGAIVTREVAYSIPAGQHRLILTDIPGIQANTMKIDLGEGASLISSQVVETEFLSPEFLASPDLAAARAAVEAAREAKRAVEVERAEAQGVIEASNARIDFAKKLGQGEGAAPDRQALYDLAGVVGGLVADGIKTRTAAEHKIEALEFRLEEAELAVERAEAALNALYPETYDFRTVVLTVDAGAAVDGKLRVTHLAAAGWKPVYEVRVSTGDAPTLQLERRIGVVQMTGEPWTNVAVSFSTLNLSKHLDAREPDPWPRRIEEPNPQPEPRRMTMADTAGALEAPVLEAPVEFQESSGPLATKMEAMGMDIRYTAPRPLDIPSSRYGEDFTQVELDTLEFTLDDLYAIAVPLRYETAILRATMTNDSSEVLLPGEATFYRDGLMAGSGQLPLLVPNASEELGLGEIRGLRIKRVIRDRLEGDRGVIVRSNENTEDAVLSVENVTDRPWDVRLMDRVPYSEQEDLEITWEASREPSETNVDDKRGVLAWRNTVAPGETWQVELSHRIKWPEGYVLR